MVSKKIYAVMDCESQFIAFHGRLQWNHNHDFESWMWCRRITKWIYRNMIRWVLILSTSSNLTVDACTFCIHTIQYRWPWFPCYCYTGRFCTGVTCKVTKFISFQPTWPKVFGSITHLKRKPSLKIFFQNFGPFRPK